MPAQNLVVQSMAFNTGWTLTASTVTADAVAGPDGTMTADSLNEDGTLGFHYISRSASAPSGQYTGSVSVKASGRSWCLVSIDGGATAVNFNVGAGAVGRADAGNVGLITSMGSGWYRCQVTKSGVTNPSLSVFAETGEDGYNYTGTSISSLYLADAQIEQSNAMGDYIATTTAAVNTGAPANKRLAQNLQRYSDSFDNAAWTKEAGAVVTADQATMPDGTLADLIDLTACAAGQGVYQTQTALAAAKVIARSLTISVWVRAVSGTCNARIADASAAGGDKTVSVTTDWQRIQTTYTSATAATGLYLRKPASGAGALYVGHAQLEVSDVAGDYIQTTTVAAA